MPFYQACGHDPRATEARGENAARARNGCGHRPGIGRAGCGAAIRQRSRYPVAMVHRHLVVAIARRAAPGRAGRGALSDRQARDRCVRRQRHPAFHAGGQRAAALLHFDQLRLHGQFLGPACAGCCACLPCRGGADRPGRPAGQDSLPPVSGGAGFLASVADHHLRHHLSHGKVRTSAPFRRRLRHRGVHDDGRIGTAAALHQLAVIPIASGCGRGCRSR